MSRTYRTTVYREDELGDEYGVTVRYTITPGYAGDRVDPPCEGEIEIDSATADDGSEVHLTLAEIQRVFADHEDDGPDPDDMRDRMIDERLTGAA